MRAIRIVLGLVVVTFGLVMCVWAVGLFYRVASGPSPSAVSTSAKETEKAGTESLPKAPSAPRTFDASKKAIEGVAEAGEVGRDASAKVHVAVGKPAMTAEEGHKAEEAAKFEEVKASLAPEELKLKMDELVQQQEAIQQIRDNIAMVKKSMARVADFLGENRRQFLQHQGASAGVDALRRRDIREKEEALKGMEAQIKNLQQQLRVAELKATNLDKEIRSKTKTTHRFER